MSAICYIKPRGQAPGSGGKILRAKADAYMSAAVASSQLKRCRCISPRQPGVSLFSRPDIGYNSPRSDDRLSDEKNQKMFHTITYGCQMNENDTERLAGQLKALGYDETDRLADADVILINTCCVRESAEKKIHGKIGELKRLKSANPNL